MKTMEYKGRNLVCLIPREGKGGITSHEKTLCDCEVIEILEELQKYKEAYKILIEELVNIGKSAQRIPSVDASVKRAIDEVQEILGDKK